MKTIKIQTKELRFEIELPSLEVHNKIPAPVEIYLASNDTICKIESIEIFGNGPLENFKTETIFSDVYGNNKYKLTIQQERKFIHGSPTKYFHSAQIEVKQDWKWIGGLFEIK